MSNRIWDAIRNYFVKAGRKAGSQAEAFASSRAFSWFAVIVFALAVTMLMTVSPQKIPEDLEEGLIAVHDIKADRNYEIVDEEATEKQKVEASSAVLPVFDHDASAAENAAVRLIGAFEAAEKELKTSAKRVGAPALSPERREAISKTFRDISDIELTGAQFDALVNERFNKRIAGAVIGAVRGALSVPVVADKAAIEDSGGLVLRIVKKDAAKGEAVREDIERRDTAGIQTAEEARAQAERYLTSRGGQGSPSATDASVALAKALIAPNATPNIVETDMKRQDAAGGVSDVIIKITSGEMIIREGARFEPRHIKVLHGILKERGRAQFGLEMVGIFLLVLFFSIVPFYVAEKFFTRVSARREDNYFMAFTAFIVLAVTRLSFMMAPGVHDAFLMNVPVSTLYYAMPVAGGAMLVRMFLSAELSITFAIALSVAVGLFPEADLRLMVYCLACSFAAVIAIAKVDKRSLILKAGAKTGAAAALAAVALKFISMLSPSETMGVEHLVWTVFFAFTGGVGSSIFVMIVAPLVESATSYTSDIKLLELANLNHPLLRELIVRAPGTYHHSHVVGILGEAAAEAIGANALLVRVGAYYHDIGKMRKPLYFIENAKEGENKHEKLSPHMSALIVAAHVKDGVEMARAAKLPKVMMSLIAEHHGTRLIGYFYEKAKISSDPDMDKIDEKEFRYEGPRPQSREAAILMLADITEASVRSLKEKSSSRVQQTVQRSFNEVFVEAQIGECDLTLKDLNEIAKAFVRIFLGIYHQRIEYPKEAANGKDRLEITVAEERAPAPPTGPLQD